MLMNDANKLNISLLMLGQETAELYESWYIGTRSTMSIGVGTFVAQMIIEQN